MSIASMSLYQNVAAFKALPKLSWKAKDGASINRHFLKLDALPPAHEKVLDLYMNEGLTEQQIASRLSCTLRVVRRLLTEGFAPLDEVQAVGVS